MDISNKREAHLRKALREADDNAARYHIREALQLCVAEQSSSDETV